MKDSFPPFDQFNSTLAKISFQQDIIRTQYSPKNHYRLPMDSISIMTDPVIYLHILGYE